MKRKMSSTLNKSLVSNVNEESQLPLPEGSTVDLPLPIPERSTNDLQHERSPILPILSDSQESRLLPHFTPSSEEIPDSVLANIELPTSVHPQQSGLIFGSTNFLAPVIGNCNVQIHYHMK